MQIFRCLTRTRRESSSTESTGHEPTVKSIRPIVTAAVALLLGPLSWVNSQAQTTTAPPAAAVPCAAEGGTCTIPSGTIASVFYGAGTSWAVRNGVSASIGCNNAVFGDPLRGMVKSCRYQPTGAVPPANQPPANQPPATAVACASEGGTCTIPAGITASVFYGAGTNWAVRTSVTVGIGCNNAVFGDPLRGTVKSCRYQSTATTPAPDLTPTAIVAQAGASQAGTVNTAVATRPAVRVTTRDGRPVPGIRISFSVIQGGGAVSGASQSTDSAGVATVGGWTLGSAVGEQRLVARTPGLPEVSFSANAQAAAGSGQLERLPGGDGQNTTVGNPVPVAPSVLVRGSNGAPMANVSVAFTVRQGGGSIQNGTALTNADGVATVGRWTLGANPGLNVLEARASGYGSASFSATALELSAPTFTRDVWQVGLAAPWDIAFAPDGAVLVTQRGRGLFVRLPSSGELRQLFRPSDFVEEGQSGMLGVAVDPDFRTNRTLYVFMASNAGGMRDNRVVRFRVNEGYTAISDRLDILTGIAYSGGAHSGGRLGFGPDGLLYVTTGDNRIGTVPQSPTVLGGKVLRITRDGTAADNRAPNGMDARIFTFGHRNPQGITFRPAGGASPGTPFLCEHGPGNSDEVTRIVAGGNGGWDPRPTGEPPRCPNGSTNSYCGYEGSLMTDTVKFPSAMRPTWSTGAASRGMSGCGFVEGPAWGSWNGALAVALLSGRRAEILRLNADGSSATSTPILNDLNERLRHVTMGPDGALWVLTDGKTGGDEIWRLVPTPANAN